jgi:DNA repair exonuclease SbcCD ATPase subunit
LSVNPKCPCGDFQAGDPSDAHSARHTAWLNRDDAPPLVVAINRATERYALPPEFLRIGADAESTSAALRRVEQERDAAWRFLAVRAGQLNAADAERDQLDAEIERLEAERDIARAELAAERDKRAENIAQFERACGLAVVAERERDDAKEQCVYLNRKRLDAIEERDELAAGIEKIVTERGQARFDLGRALSELASARTELDAVRTARDNLDRLLAAAHKEIEQLDADLKLCPRCGIEVDAEVEVGTPALASWIVARDGGRDCVRCGQEIRRGEAYELHNAAADELEHIYCRDRTEEPSDG